MSDVASQPLCAELYEVSGWVIGSSTDIYDFPKYSDRKGNFIAPAYDAGYLLRKLPLYTEIEQIPGGWFVTNNEFSLTADTIEDALCTLAIELFKAGVLKREVSA